MALNWTRFTAADAVAAAVVVASALIAVEHAATVSPGLNARWWAGMAAEVVAGATPYVDAPDNKPPIWLLVQVGAESTGAHDAVVRSLWALSAVVVLVPVARLARRHYGPWPATAAVLTMAVFLVRSGAVANNKIPALALVLVGVVAARPRRSAVAMAAGASIAQQFALVAAVVGLCRWRSGAWSRRDLGGYALVGIAVGVAQFLMVALAWGLPAGAAAVEQSVLAAGPYVSGASSMPDHGVVGNVGLWAVVLARGRDVLALLPIFVLTAIGTRSARRRTVWHWWCLASVPVLLMTVFDAYWLFAAPAVAMLSAVGVAGLVPHTVGVPLREVSADVE